MRVLIGCESSGVTRRAFRDAGHDAWSCDLLPSEDNSPYHFQCDVREVIDLWWDMAIFHPDCTYLTNSAAWAYTDGPYHQKVKPGTPVGLERRILRQQALEFVQFLMDAPIERIAIENPVGVISTTIRPADQYIQPFEYGHSASKKTGLWLKNLPVLRPTCIVPGRIANGVERWDNQTDSGQNKLTPSPDRWRERSRTYDGWSQAMVTQWGNLPIFQGDQPI
jgi:hypothetical protein